jgi:glutathione S-transferase
MSTCHLYLGTKQFSSWSLRPWLLMAYYNVPFTETVFAFDDRFKDLIAPIAPNGKVPALVDKGLTICDSLAICEYINEAYLHGAAWPKDLKARALARSVVAEMHSGFASLRQQMPMDVLRSPAPVARVSEATELDIARIRAIWTDLLRQSGGPFLFGEFSIADCFYAPVATRFHHYAVALSAIERAYVDGLYQLPSMQRWLREAQS